MLKSLIPCLPEEDPNEKATSSRNYRTADGNTANAGPEAEHRGHWVSPGHNKYAPGVHNDEQRARAEYHHCLEDAKPIEPIKPVAFRPWQQVWQCNDIRIVEFSNRQGLIEYDLSGTIWGGSQFARDLNRDMLFFNGRPCLKVAR